MYKIEGDTVIFDEKFNEVLKEDILSVISKYPNIKFGCRFNQRIDNLPQGLKRINLWGDFNQHIDNLPQGLKELYIEGNFNQRIDNLPQGLTGLVIHRNFNQPIDNLPQGLKVLTLGGNFNQPIDFLPFSLEELQIYNLNYSYDLLNLPSNLKNLKVRKTYKGQLVLSPNCEKIEI